ncbi:MAG: hypothetical protein V7K21_18760 [Nostoc sp.]|uniref:hypothetical protein n=1 Tax=Nostoc sp. TaxID=1180 RepID=UPI002FF9D5C1
MEILQAIALFNEPQRRREHRGRRGAIASHCTDFTGDHFFNEPQRRRGHRGRREESDRIVEILQAIAFFLKNPQGRYWRTF